MQLRYANEIRIRFPKLCTRAVLIGGIEPNADPTAQIDLLRSLADTRLAGSSEGEFPEIQAWRRAFSSMGFKPTQYRCAPEALLRRYRKEGALPQLHPLVDLCNAASLAFATPVAVFDTARVTGALTVRQAAGDETYETFGGEIEAPEPDEIIFADDVSRAHARRWTNRQSGWSAVRASTVQALIVAEALHDTAATDIGNLMAALIDSLIAVWPDATLEWVAPQ